MKKAFLPALIAGMFAAGGAIAADRELLFGPAGLADVAPMEKVTKAPKIVKVTKPKAAAPVLAKTEPKVEAKAAEPVVIKAAPVVAKTETKPVAVIAKVQPKPAPVAVAAPVIAKVQPKPLPAPVAAPVIAKVQVVPPKMPAMPVSLAMASPDKSTVSAGTNPLMVREQLFAKLKTSVNVGFFPSAIASNDNFSFINNFMPLSNLLSSQTGVLVNFIPERSPQQFLPRISEVRYPVIFINGSMTREAIAAGYKPLVVAKDDITASYVVKASSPLKSIQDIKNVKVAWALNAQTALLAMADVARYKLTGNSYVDIGTAGRSAVLQSIDLGTADVGVWRANEMTKEVANSKGLLRLLGAGASSPSVGMWIRGDLSSTEFAKRLRTSMLSVSPDSADENAKTASLSFTKGFGVSGEFVQPQEKFLDDLNENFRLATQSFPGSFQEIKVDESARKKSMAHEVFAVNSKFHTEDMLTARQAMLSKFTSQVNVGFYPTAASPNENLSFVKSFMPFANYLSEKTGVLVNLIPERNLSTYSMRIAEDRYSVIFINSGLAHRALSAGYLPVAVGIEKIAPGWMVLANSPIQKVEDIKRARIAWSANAQSVPFAMADLSRMNSLENTVVDTGTSGLPGVLSALTSGAADVGEYRSIDMEKVKDSRFRYLGTGTSVPSSGMWIRRDLLGTEFAKRLTESLLAVKPDSPDASAKAASIGLSAGFGTRGEFIEPPTNFAKDMKDHYEALKKGFPLAAYEEIPEEKERDDNLVKPTIEQIQPRSK